MGTTTISYTDRDFSSIRVSLINRIKAEFPDDWADFTESNIGIAWLELVAHSHDVLSFYLDESVRNQFLKTADDREAVILITELVGYRLRSATSASVLCLAAITDVQAVDVIIQAGSVVQSNSGLSFQTLQDQVIPAGMLSANILFLEGLSQQENLVSDGTPFQLYKLTQAPVTEGSVVVTVDGFTWSAIESLVFADEASDNFEVKTDVEDFAYLRFGDGSSGAIPSAGSVITVTYRVGGGATTNIAPNDISGVKVDGLLQGSSPESFVSVTITNQQRGSGGEDRETLDSAKFWAPKHATANGRAVTEQDFDTLATRFSDPVYGAPAYCKSMLKQRIPELNTVLIYVWARDGYGNIVPASDGLKSAISNYFNNNGAGAVRIITVTVEVVDGLNVFIDVDALVTSDGTRSATDVSLDVQQSLKAYFSLASNQPGTDIRLSRLYNLIQSVDGVEHAIIRRVTASSIQDEPMGISNGVVQQYTYTTFALPIPGTVIIQAGSFEVRDDGNGKLTGDVDPIASNVIDYTTGVLKFSFITPVPPAGTGVTIEYRYALDYLRSESGLFTGNGVTDRFRGQLSNFPLVAGSVSFTDGDQTIQDDSDGGFTGSINATGNNRIDYDTGSFDFTLKVAPGEDRSIAAIYHQLLSLNAGDVPVDESQLAVPGFMDVTME